MREIRQSGSEGGGGETNRLSLPLFPEFSQSLHGFEQFLPCVGLADLQIDPLADFVGLSRIAWYIKSQLEQGPGGYGTPTTY